MITQGETRWRGNRAGRVVVHGLRRSRREITGMCAARCTLVQHYTAFGRVHALEYAAARTREVLSMLTSGGGRYRRGRSEREGRK